MKYLILFLVTNLSCIDLLSQCSNGYDSISVKRENGKICIVQPPKPTHLNTVYGSEIYGCLRMRPPVYGIPTGDSLYDRICFRYIPKGYNAINCDWGYLPGFYYNYSYLYEIDTNIFRYGLLNSFRNGNYGYNDSLVEYNTFNAQTKVYKGRVDKNGNSFNITKPAEDSFKNRVLENVHLESIDSGDNYYATFVAVYDNDGSFRKLYLEDAELDTGEYPEGFEYYEKNGKYPPYSKWTLAFKPLISKSGSPLTDSYLSRRIRTPHYFQWQKGLISELSRNEEYYINKTRKFTRKKLLEESGSYYYSEKDSNFESKHYPYKQFYIITYPVSVEDFFAQYHRVENEFKKWFPGMMEQMVSNLRNMPKMTPHPYSFSTEHFRTGYVTDINKVEPKDVYGFFLRFYISNYCGEKKYKSYHYKFGGLNKI